MVCSLVGKQCHHYFEFFKKIIIDFARANPDRDTDLRSRRRQVVEETKKAIESYTRKNHNFHSFKSIFRAELFSLSLSSTNCRLVFPPLENAGNETADLLLAIFLPLISIPVDHSSCIRTVGKQNKNDNKTDTEQHSRRTFRS